MSTNPQKTADFFTFTKEFLNGKLLFLCSIYHDNMEKRKRKFHLWCKKSNTPATSFNKPLCQWFLLFPPRSTRLWRQSTSKGRLTHKYTAALASIFTQIRLKLCTTQENPSSSAIYGCAYDRSLKLALI